MFLLKSQTEADENLTVARQKQWQSTLTILFDQQQKHGAKPPETRGINRTAAEYTCSTQCCCHFYLKKNCTDNSIDYFPGYQVVSIRLKFLVQ